MISTILLVDNGQARSERFCHRFIWSNETGKPRVLVMAFLRDGRLQSQSLVSRNLARDLFKRLLNQGMTRARPILNYNPMSATNRRAIAFVTEQSLQLSNP